MLNFNWDSVVSPVPCGRVVEVPATLKKSILRNTVSHTESNVLSSTDSCACTGTVKEVSPGTAGQTTRLRKEQRERGRFL